MQAITVAGEMRIFRRILMAVAVPASRDFKRKIDGTRTSNLCEVLALLDRRSECGDGAEADEDGARDVALDRRKARAAAESLAERAGADPERAHEPGAAAAADRRRDDVEHRRSRHGEKRQRGADEEREAARIEHAADLSGPPPGRLQDRLASRSRCGITV